MQSELIRFTERLASESGRLIREHFRRSDTGIDYKPDRSPVTEADRRAEEHMRTMIRREYPGHGVIGEEFGTENGDAEYVWTLDPIDGTLSFIAGCPLFGTLIGLLQGGRPILGAIHQPVVGDLVIGDGDQTRLNGKPIRVRETEELSRATLLTTDVRYVGTYQDRQGFDDLVAATGLLRTWGDCYGYFLVASGGADIMLDPIMNPWDLIPLIPIIRGAGGEISSWTGTDAVTATSAVAASSALHPRVIAILNGHRRPSNT